MFDEGGWRLECAREGYCRIIPIGFPFFFFSFNNRLLEDWNANPFNQFDQSFFGLED